jgi:hypothetical protein
MSRNPFAPARAASTSAPVKPLDDAVAQVQAELLRRGPMAITQEAWDALEAATAEHMGSVGVLAVHLAHRDGLAQVDKKHIEQAHAYIGARPRASISVFITSSLGSLFAGIGGGIVGSIMAEHPAMPVTNPALLISLALTVIGLMLVVISIVITIVSRRH